MSAESFQFLPKPLNIMGLPLTPFQSYEEAVQCAEERITASLPSLCFSMNPEKVYLARRNPALLKSLQQANFAICDGVGVAVAAKWLLNRQVPRCTGVDFFAKMAELAADKGWPVFLLGSTEASNAKAAERLQESFPGLVVAGRRDGYFEDDPAVVAEINHSGAMLLFVGMGSPRQELWLGKNREQLVPSFCMAVGGSLDIWSGHTRRAPDWVRKGGLEFLYRSPPSRWRRLLRRYIFLGEVLLAWAGKKGKGKRP